MDMGAINTDPSDEHPGVIFTVTNSPSRTSGARIGRILLPGRNVIDTPQYLGNSSRGVIPHISQDNFKRHTTIGGVYFGLEDFIERAPADVPPLLRFQPPDVESALRVFTALPDDTVVVLGARRTPPVASPSANSNTNDAISVCTSVGFQRLDANEYAETAENLKPDIAVGLGDIPYGRTLGSKRIEKATDRCIQWLRDHIELRHWSTEPSKTHIFASLLPVSCAKQQFYVDVLMDDELSREISGLAIYDLDTLEDLPESLEGLPRLAFTEPDSPHEVLRQIGFGLDLFTIPFITSATDAGISFDFAFPVPTELTLAHHEQSAPRDLGIDMWSSSHATDLAPLSLKCQCYSCRTHHRAYVQHLLSAKEMLGWVLLQLHNHHTMNLFFAGARHSISNGTFEQDVIEFARTYQPRLPEKTGQGPRVRGYQFKSEGPGEPKKNAAPFTTLNDGKEKLAEASPPPADADANILEQQGFAEKE